MSKPLFQGLKKIGVDEATAYEVSHAMNPERYATRQDLLEAIRAIDKSIAAHREETQKTISAHREETQKTISAIHTSISAAISAIHTSISAHREETQKTISAIHTSISVHREETQKTIATTNRQLLLFCIGVMATLITFLVRTWH